MRRIQESLLLPACGLAIFLLLLPGSHPAGCATTLAGDHGIGTAAGNGRYTVTINDDYSYPQYGDFDYGLNPVDIEFSNEHPAAGEEVTITAHVHNNGLCRARGAYGWYSSTGRSCWAEWDFEYPEPCTVDINYRCRDDVSVDWRVELDGVHLVSISVPGVGSGTQYKIVTVHDVPITAGPHTLFLGTYQMDYYPDYEIDWVRVGDMHREAETYDRMGGNDPNSDLRGLIISPMAANPPENCNRKLQLWDGDPEGSGTLLAEDFVGAGNMVIDNQHVYPGGTYKAHYIENNGEGTLECQWVPTETGTREIFAVFDPLDLFDEMDEENNVASRSIHVGPAELAIVTGPGQGPVNPPLVRLFSTAPVEWLAYGVSRQGVHVACGDLDGSGLDSIITGPGPGPVYGPHVRAFDSSGTADAGVNFMAYMGHQYGVLVAAGDIDGDGYDEIITGAGAGLASMPHIRGWNVDGQGGVEAIGAVNFLAYGTGNWGVTAVCGDIDGDGFDEIVTGPGPGPVYGPHVRAWNYDGGSETTAMPRVNFMAYGQFRFGTTVACGDLDGDGLDEIITGPGPGCTLLANVRSWNYDGGSVSAMPGVDFLAYSAECCYGVITAAADLDGDGLEEIITVPGPDPAQPAHVRAWNVDGETVTPVSEIDFIAYGDLELTGGGQVACGWF